MEQKISAKDICDMCMLQILFKHKCMLESEAKEKCAVIYRRNSDEVYHSVLTRLGLLLDDLKMQIKTFKHFNDHRKYIALINQIEDEAAKLSSNYTFPQLQFFFNLIEHIATQEGAEDGVCNVRMNDALNLHIAAASHLRQLTQEQVDTGLVQMCIAEKETTIERLVEDRWLIKDDNSHLAIGPRSFLELKTHLLTLDLPEATQEAWEAAL